MNKNWSLRIGGVIFLVIIIIAFLAPYFPFVDVSLKKHAILTDGNGKIMSPPFPPSSQFLIGSDQNGVDLLSRLLIGTKETMIIIFGIAILRYALAIPLSIGAFYYRTAKFFLASWNQLFSYLPPIFFVAIIVGLPFIFFSSFHALWIGIVIALIEVGRVAEIFLKKIEDTSQKPFIESGIASGCTRYRLFKNYLWPELLPHVLTNFFVDLGRVLFLIAQLGVVGIYISHEFISGEVANAYKAVNTSHAWPLFLLNITYDIWSNKWIPFAAISAITITLFSIHLIADGLQKHFQQKYRSSKGIGI